MDDLWAPKSEGVELILRAIILYIKMVKIGVHLRKLSQKLKLGYHFLDHPVFEGQL